MDSFNNHFRVDDMETRVTREYEQFDEFIRLTNQTAVEAVLSAEAETKVWDFFPVPRTPDRPSLKYFHRSAKK